MKESNHDGLCISRDVAVVEAADDADDAVVEAGVDICNVLPSNHDHIARLTYIVNTSFKIITLVHLKFVVSGVNM